MSNIFDNLRSYLWSFIKLSLAVGLVVYVALYFISNSTWHQINDSVSNLFSDVNEETRDIRKNAGEISKDVKGIAK